MIMRVNLGQSLKAPISARKVRREEGECHENLVLAVDGAVICEVLAGLLPQVEHLRVHGTEDFNHPGEQQSRFMIREKDLQRISREVV